MKKMYVASRLYQDIPAKAGKKNINIKLVQDDKGIVGMLPVFKTKKHAYKVVGKGIPLATILFDKK